MEEDPLLEAGKKYRKLQEYTEKLANAAHQHPEVAYDRGSTPNIGREFVEQDELTEEEAIADMKLFSYLVSDAWQETQEHFIFDLEDQVEIYIQEMKEVNKDLYREAFEELSQKSRELDQELSGLDRALEQVLDKTPGQKFEEVELEPAKSSIVQSD